MKRFRVSTKLTIVLWISCALSFAMAQPSDHEQRARQILDETGIKGGLIVHIGSGEGRLTAALGEKKCYVVQGLEADAEKVRNARQYVRSLGRYGRVSVGQWDGRRLPYADGSMEAVFNYGIIHHQSNC